MQEAESAYAFLSLKYPFGARRKIVTAIFIFSGALILPTSVGSLLAFALLMIGLQRGLSNIKIERNEIALIYMLLLFSTIAFAPAILKGSTEAEIFFVRALVATFAFLTVFIILQKIKPSGFVSHLHGVVFFSTLNSIVVIVTALWPQLYDLLKIGFFSGSEKSASFLRSPGLLQGYDAAGFTAVIGLVALLTLSIVRPVRTLVLFLCYISLLLSTALSSRTSLALFSLCSLLWLVRNNVMHHRRISQSALNLFIVLCGLSFGLISLVLIIGVWDVGLVEKYSFGALTPGSLSRIYNIGDFHDYQSHFDFSSLTMFPNPSIHFLPDNSYLRIGVSAGIWGMIVSALAFSFIALSSQAAKSGLYGEYFIFVFAIVLVSSLKTNYLYYLPFAVVCATALKFSRAEAKRSMSRSSA